MKRARTKYPGVYSRRSQTRTHEGKADVCFDITYKKDGRKVWEKVGWASEGYSAKMATQVRGERLRAIRHGQELPNEKAKVPLLSEMAEIYLKWADENKLGDINDRFRYNHLRDSLGNKRLSEISPFDLERLKSDLGKKGLSPASIKHVLVLLRQIYNKATTWQKYKGANPVKGVKLPSLNNRRLRFLTHEEAASLLAELAKVSETLHDQALLSLHCGLRAGEIFNLRWQDLDFQNEVIQVLDPKNKESRAAYMTQAVKDMLKRRVPEKPTDLIFGNYAFDPHSRRISKDFKKVADALFNPEVQDSRQRVVFHTLRHTFGSWLAIQGTPLLTIKELMGHKTLAMTERYAHLIPDMKRRATLDLEAKFNQRRTGKKQTALQQ
jgi:integrase